MEAPPALSTAAGLPDDDVSAPTEVGALDAHGLAALADVASKQLFISLPPASPLGKPLVEAEQCGSPAELIRALRKRLNVTQREFGVLLSPGGASPISPSVVCQFESAQSPVPPALVRRAVACTQAAQRLGEYLHFRPGSTSADAAAALKSLGPGCISELGPYLDATPGLAADESALVSEFLAVVTKRRTTTGGSRPGARGPYRKSRSQPSGGLSKLSSQGSSPATPIASSKPKATLPTCTATGVAGHPPIASASALLAAAAAAGAPVYDDGVGRGSPRVSLTLSASTSTIGSTISGAGSEALGSAVGNSGGCSGASAASDLSCSSSARSTPCSTPTSSRGSSRPRSPASDLLPSPGGEVVSLQVLTALRRLQEENESLLQENKRLKARVEAAEVPDEDLARSDVTMSC